MNENVFNVEESAALLHAVFPNYPDLRGMKLVPEVGAFLQGLRAGVSSHSETPELEPCVAPDEARPCSRSKIPENREASLGITELINSANSHCAPYGSMPMTCSIWHIGSKIRDTPWGEGCCSSWADSTNPFCSTMSVTSCWKRTH
jgi:hypothetical protein